MTDSVDVYENSAIAFRYTKTREEYVPPVTVYGIKAATALVNNWRAENPGNPIEISFDELTYGKWRQRESARISTGFYRALPPHVSAKLNLLQEAVGGTSQHFLHISADGKGVAYTPDHKHGVLDRQVKTTFARYLTKFFSEVMQPHEIRDFAATLFATDYEMHIGGSRADFRKAYSDQFLCSPSSSYRSCMSYEPEYYGLDIHPAEVYAGGDLKIATLFLPQMPSTILARAILYPDCEIHGYIYAASEAARQILRQKLHENGFEREDSDMEGARLLKIPAENGWRDSDCYVMPYLDGQAGISDEGDFFRISSCRSAGYADSTGGKIRIKPAFCCGHCDDSTGEDYARTVYVRGNYTEMWCDICTSENAFYCEETDEYYSDDDFTCVEMHISSRGGIRRVCLEEYCNYFVCDNTGEYYNSDAFEEIEVHTKNGTETWCAKKTVGEYFECDNSNNFYSCHDFSTVEVETSNGTETWCSEETLKITFECAETGKIYSCDDFTDIEVRQEDGTVQTWCKEETEGRFGQAENGEFLSVAAMFAGKSIAYTLTYMIRQIMFPANREG